MSSVRVFVYQALLLLVLATFPRWLSAQAGNPIPVDALIDMNGSAVGTQTSPAVMAAGTRGTGINWQVNDSVAAMKVGPGRFNLPGPIRIGNTVYDATYQHNSLQYDTAYSFNTFRGSISGGRTRATAAGYITFGIPNQGGSGGLSDLVRFNLAGGGGSVMQLYNGNGPGYVLNIEKYNGATLHSAKIPVEPGSTYWYCYKVDYVAGMAYLNVYSVPGFNLIGSVTMATATGTIEWIHYGNGENAEAGNPGQNFNYFELSLIDWTNAAFPLLPSSDTTPPSTPTDLTATPISANQIDLSWTASDDEVGVEGYRLFQNGLHIENVADTFYSDVGLTALTMYSYTVAAYDAAGNTSEPSASVEATTTNTQQTATPTFSLPSGTYNAPQSVVLSSASPGATIYYTTDGSTPTIVSDPYVQPIPITRTTTLKAIASVTDWIDSAVATATYTLAAVTPTFSPGGGTYNTPQNVALSDTSLGATIYYTTDGSTPTTSSNPYAAPILVTQTTTIKAMAAAAGWTDSGVAAANYTLTLRAATPTFSPLGGTYNAPQSVVLSSASPGVTIYYTTNGSTPTASSTPYTGPISVTRTTTIRALAGGGGWSSSPVASATFTLRAATPTFSPGGGTYNMPQGVTLTSASPDVPIYYTTNGNTPKTSSTRYVGPIPVTRTTTIRARAIASGWTSSTVASTTYTLKVATPTFSPPAGTYTGAQTITLSVASPGATIYYTTNGSTPTTKSTRYTRPIVITRTRTIKAIAAALGWSNSAIGSARYVIN
jgi:hypothetical protein